MKFCMHIPLGDITPDQFQSIAAIQEMARALEAARLDACYVTDHPAPAAEWLHANGHDALDPFTSLAFVAAATTRLLLLTYVVVLPYRNPFVTAKAAATLQVISGGRLILGTGAGYQKVEFDALGVDFHRRGALFDEALDVIDVAWRGGVVVKQGSNFTAVGNEPRPVPDPRPPIWIGGATDKAVHRAARWGSGWVPAFSTPTLTKANRDNFIQTLDQLRQKIGMLYELRASHGKSGPIDVAIGPRDKPKVATRSEADRYLAALADLEGAGVTWAIVDVPHPSRSAYIENVQWFGEEVVMRMAK